MQKSKKALEKFPSYNCAQTVFSVFADELMLDEETALKLTSGFGGGMARAETCGAVTASYLVIGLKHGHASADLLEKNNTKELILKFNKKFVAKHGSLICKELVGCDISTPEGQVKAKEKNAFNEFCPHFVATACAILENDF